MTETRTFEPDGRGIAFVDEGEGPVSLVLIAGGGLESDGVGVVAHYLAEEAGFRVIRIGARVGVADATPRERADDAAAVLDHLSLSTSWVGGHGGGGTIARAFAAEHPERVLGLLLLGVEEHETPLAPLIPVLIIQGADDEVTPPKNGESVRAMAPERASVKMIDGAGHDFPLSHPIETAVVIEEYLDWD